MALADHTRALLEVIGNSESTTEEVGEALVRVMRIVNPVDAARASAISAAGADMIRRLGAAEQVMLEKSLAAVKAEQKKNAKGTDHDKGSASAIEWIKPIPPEEADAKLVLDATTGTALRDLLAQIRTAGEFTEQGIRTPLKIQMIGPPGTGKTLSAQWIASHLGKVLAIVRVDELVSSFVGKSGKNIRAVFKKATKMGAVIFLDEIDAVAIRRDQGGSSSGSEENRRMTTALLQILNTLAPDQVVLAATNLAWLLDPALVRRLPTRIVFGYPDEPARREMISRWWNRLKLPATVEAVTAIVRATEGKSGAYLEEVAHEAARRAIVDRVAVEPRHVWAAEKTVPVGEELQAPTPRGRAVVSLR